MTIISTEYEVYSLPFRCHGWRPPGKSGKVGRNTEPRCLRSSVQELKIRERVSLRGVLLGEFPIYPDRRHSSGGNFISPGVTSGWGAVEISREENRTFGYSSFESTPG